MGWEEERRWERGWLKLIDLSETWPIWPCKDSFAPWRFWINVSPVPLLSNAWVCDYSLTFKRECIKKMSWIKCLKNRTELSKPIFSNFVTYKRKKWWFGWSSRRGGGGAQTHNICFMILLVSCNKKSSKVSNTQRAFLIGRSVVNPLPLLLDLLLDWEVCFPTGLTLCSIMSPWSAMRQASLSEDSFLICINTSSKPSSAISSLIESKENKHQYRT